MNQQVPVSAPGQAHADEESSDVVRALFIASRATPLPADTTILDDAWWAIAHLRAEEERARVAYRTAAEQAYFESLATSPREDYHRTFADLYGLEPVLSERWSNSYIGYQSLSFRLNSFENLTEGVTMVQRLYHDVEFTDVTYLVAERRPVERVNGVLRTLSVWASWFGRPIPDVPAHRCRWTCVRDKRCARCNPASGRPHRNAQHLGAFVCDPKVQVVKPRASRRELRDVKAPVAPKWENPYVIEDGTVLLRTAEGGNFSQVGTEGLTVLYGPPEHDDVGYAHRLHLVHWITKRQRFWAKSTLPDPKPGQEYWWNPGERTKNPAKIPLEVMSFPLGTTEDEVLNIRAAVRAGMERSCLDGREHHLLPSLAAALNFEDSESVDALTGSPEWLQLVADQAETHETYRNRGHGPDTDD
jgi:hypothetical protein